MVEGIEVEAIATMYGVHRTTVTRWIGACRDRLLVETRRFLRDDFGLAIAEIDSLAGLVRSQLHLSLAQLLGERWPRRAFSAAGSHEPARGVGE